MVAVSKILRHVDMTMRYSHSNSSPRKTVDALAKLGSSTTFATDENLHDSN